MLNVGLTGNVAAGKSTVSEWFHTWGATVIDSDVLVRECQEPGGPVLEAIVTAFGPEVLETDGSLNRAGLRRTVMANAAARDTLNAIVHPVVEARRQELLEAALKRGDVIVVSDIPLLFEATDPETFDAIVLVDAPEAVRKARLMEHRHLAADEADRLIKAQWPADQKRARSDFVIDNAGNLTDFRDAARTVWDALQARALDD